MARRLGERIANSFSALALRGCRESVQVRGGGIGKIVTTKIFEGRICVRTDKGQEWVEGRRVATLDECLP